MSLIVNTNIASINAQRSLSRISRDLDTSLERLSSGLRINSAADDAAGLAIADGLATQVQGLTQAARNANDGLSVIGIAEGSVSQQTEIVQRIRELSVQAASDTNSSSDRQLIQDEIDEQLEELDRIATTTEFNGQKLLDGTFSNKNIQVGAFSNQSIGVSIDDFRATNMGLLSTFTSTNGVNSAKPFTAADALTINGTTIAASSGYSTYDTVSTVNNAGSAIAKAAAINASSSTTGVTAKATAAVYTGTTAITAGNVNAGTITINNVLVVDGVNDPFAVTASDGTGTLTSRINAKSNQTGVVASVNASGMLVLTAEDGRNINVVTTAVVPARVGLAASTTFTEGGHLQFTSTDDFTMSTTASDGDIIGEAAATIAMNGAADYSKVMSKIDVTSSTGANTAMDICDAALDQIATSEAKLGALTNRLDYTISNIEVAIENMSSSESQIRDADFAAETANLTRAQIIQQSSVAVLAQANTTPQTALTLLQ